MDVRAAVKSTLRIEPGGRALIPCGFAIAVPPGYEAQLRPRSGLATKFGVTLVNSPGTIDSDYRGEVGVALINLGTEVFEVPRGLRIAQMVIAPVSKVEWNEVQDLQPTARNSGGFGHTGT
jgi:dUTP pyrophosphatase